MNPQGGEGNNNQPLAANAAAVVDRPLNATVEPNAGVSSNPLDKLEGVVAAAKLEAAAQPTVPVQAPEETPKGQFENQFGSGPAIPPVAESAPDLIDTALANLGTTPPAVDVSALQPSADNLVPEQTQPVETLAQPEEDPQAAFVQDIKDAVEKLEEA